MSPKVPNAMIILLSYVCTRAQNRDCMEDCVINGLLIPKGVSVQADVWTIHYDPELWGPTDPYTFDPTR